ncbi:hypothetical protein GGX14DRAFT_642836 [Mycena pura]|uniref:Histone deacetylase complex subunit SAP30 Sin3 binding domain-containing protein n=1 Tax=Mycena pura TaxID=153505 RepID=A0AAD6YQD9_9AGAR|nr:hypothetical protein GGX14DRAFT_642836 [Mycena pura]
MSVPPAPAASSRSRPPRKKPLHDDAAYFGSMPGGAGAVKRHAMDRADGEPRVKRKRVVDTGALGIAGNADFRGSLVEFVKMPTPVLYRYLTQFELIPHVKPSPMKALDPPPPATLDSPAGQASRAPSPPPPALATPANRPRRESKEQTRRRSSRLLEEEVGSRPPILADVDELHAVLARIAEQHFRELASISGREEVDTLASFMCAVEKAKGGKNSR